MIDGLTVEEYNARERQRGSIVAKLHGYTPLEEGDTEDGLKAAFRELTGEAYRSQEEEQAANVAAAKEQRQRRLEEQWLADHSLIADAKANGFMDCLAIRNGFGWDKPGPNGTYYNSMEVAYRWIEDAGEEVVYLIPDGITDVTKSERTGCFADVFARVLAYKNAVYAKRKHDEWQTNMATAVENREKYGAQTKLMDWDAYIEALGPEPPLPDADVVAAVDERRAVKADQAALEGLKPCGSL